MNDTPTAGSDELPSLAGERLEGELHRALGRAVIAFSRLDLNLALYLQAVLYPSDPKKAKAEIDSLSTKDKLDELHKSLSTLHGQKVALLADFEGWLAKAAQIRQLRNDFVHGRWAVSPVRREICFTPAGLPTSPGEAPVERRYALPEFLQEIRAIEVLANEFFGLRLKHAV